MKMEKNLNPTGIEFLAGSNTKKKNACGWQECSFGHVGLLIGIQRPELKRFEKRTSFVPNVSSDLGFGVVEKINTLSKNKRNVRAVVDCAKLLHTVLKSSEFNGGVIMLRKRWMDEQLKKIGYRFQVFAFINDIRLRDFSLETGFSLEDIRALARGELNQGENDTHVPILNSLSIQYGLNINWMLNGDGSAFSTEGPKTNMDMYKKSFLLNPKHENYLSHLLLFKVMEFDSIKCMITQKIDELRMHCKDKLEKEYEGLEATCGIDFEFIRKHFFDKGDKKSIE